MPPPPCILVIEDEPLVAMGLKLVLEAIGCDVPEVVDSESGAVAAATRHDYDLVLADVRLRDGGDGVRAVQEIQRRRDVPAVFVTGNAGDLSGRGLGDVAVLNKPFMPAALERTVRRLIPRMAERAGP